VDRTITISVRENLLSIWIQLKKLNNYHYLRAKKIQKLIIKPAHQGEEDLMLLKKVVTV
jgi:hypothetical protein